VWVHQTDQKTARRRRPPEKVASVQGRGSKGKGFCLKEVASNAEDGSPLGADGIKLFSVEQAGKRQGLKREGGASGDRSGSEETVAPGEPKREARDEGERGPVK